MGKKVCLTQPKVNEPDFWMRSDAIGSFEDCELAANAAANSKVVNDSD
jgi:hypothetical protein